MIDIENVTIAFVYTTRRYWDTLIVEISDHIVTQTETQNRISYFTPIVNYFHKLWRY